MIDRFSDCFKACDGRLVVDPFSQNIARIHSEPGKKRRGASPQFVIELASFALIKVADKAQICSSCFPAPAKCPAGRVLQQDELKPVQYFSVLLREKAHAGSINAEEEL